jgi:hypothetical protein
LNETAYVDSDVFILPVLGGNTEKTVGARRALERIEAGKLVAYTSVLTWDELVWVVSRTLGKADAAQVGRKLLSFPGLRFLDLTSSTVVRAQAICDSTGLAPRDAIHCAAALAKGIESFVTDDADIDKVPGLKRVRLESFSG